jgi:hypothetical protein
MITVYVVFRLAENLPETIFNSSLPGRKGKRNASFTPGIFLYWLF